MTTPAAPEPDDPPARTFRMAHVVTRVIAASRAGQPLTLTATEVADLHRALRVLRRPPTP